MKKIFNYLYIGFITGVYIVALGIMGINLYKEYSHGDLRTQVRFDKLCTNVKQLTAKSSNFSAGFTKQLENAVAEETDFVNLEIDINGKRYYLYSQAENGSSNEKLVKAYSKSFTSGTNSIFITGELYILRPIMIYRYAKTSFIIILITTILTAILIIYNAITQKNTVTEEVKEEIISEEEFEIKPTILKKEDLVIQPKEEHSSEEIEKTNNETITEEQNETNTSEESENTNEHENINECENLEDTNTTPQEEPVIEQQKPVEVSLPSKEIEPMDIPQDKTVPAGLFSPITGIGWESYLITRLDNELNRATASEIDLALFEIKIPEIERSNPVVKSVCNYLCEEFQFKDLIFEYKADSIVAMKISMNIEEALIFADKLYVEINRIISSENKKCFIGISTRTIRMLSGERILKEVDEAVKHAQSENEGIIAFRVDADKYRKYMESI